MNAFSFRRRMDDRIHSIDRVANCGRCIYGGPNEFDHNYLPLRHLPITDARHHSVARDVPRKIINENLRDGMQIDQVVFLHNTHPQLGGALLSTNPSHVRHKKYMPCDSFSLDRLNFSSAHHARRRLPAFPPLPWLMSAAAPTQARVS